MHTRKLFMVCVSKSFASIRWKVIQNCGHARWVTTAHNVRNGREDPERVPQFQHNFALVANRFKNPSLGSTSRQMSTSCENPDPGGVSTQTIDVPHTSDELVQDQLSSMEDDLLVEEDTDLDILAEMEDPPVLERFASLPLPSHTYTLAHYVEHSSTLQKLVELGVDLSKVEKRERVPSELLKMDFEDDIKDKLIFLTDVGVPAKELGKFITRNPHILLEEVGELQARVDYLKSKKFSDAAISQIVTRAPYFLSFSVLRVDRKLGYLQRFLQLKGAEVREVITKEPRLVTFKVSKIKENAFVLREQLGFRRLELKTLIVKEPKLLLRGKERLIGIFDYVHNVMEVPHKMMLHWPRVFGSSLHKIQERHQFLKSINRDSYDPTQPQYVALDRLSSVPDSVFCDEIAKRPLEEYNTFLKTL